MVELSEKHKQYIVQLSNSTWSSLSIYDNNRKKTFFYRTLKLGSYKYSGGYSYNSQALLRIKEIIKFIGIGTVDDIDNDLHKGICIKIPVNNYLKFCEKLTILN